LLVSARSPGSDVLHDPIEGGACHEQGRSDCRRHVALGDRAFDLLLHRWNDVLGEEL
jgi:hypothetical protein